MHIRRGVGHPSPAPTGHVEDRVTDQLTRTVVGDVATPISLDELGTKRTKLISVDQQVLTGGAATRGDRVGMLQEKQMITATDEQRPLKGQRVSVRDPPEPTDPKSPVVARAGGQRTSASQSRVSMISFTRCMNAAA